jgi:hypothetical protein
VSNARTLMGAAWLGGVVAATIDIGAACLINGRPVVYVLHTIAGGLLAERAFPGGAATALLGLGLQELMGILISAVYVLAVRRYPALLRHWFAGGLAYGVLVFVVMNYAVVPLSAWHRFTHFASIERFLGNLLAMLLFGVIVAYFGYRMLRTQPQGSVAAPAVAAQASGR